MTDRIQRAFAGLDRAVFIPDRVWPAGLESPVDRAVHPQAWAELVYSDKPVVTQVDDGEPGGIGVPSSSSSAPSIMAEMLHRLDVEPGHRVLEIGTGTGYNAAVLADLVGPAGSVTTVEVDTDVAAAARVNLAAAGRRAEVVAADGELGHPPNAPYDRVIATCGVTRIPSPWLEQAVDGAVLVAPWKPTLDLPGGLMARLTVRAGAAEGRFTGESFFMPLRGQRDRGGTPHDLHAEPETETRVEGDARDVVWHEDAGPVLALIVPAWRLGMRVTEPGATPYVWVSATDGPSWARLHPDARVEQGGPRRLWDELLAARRWWERQGCPPVTGFGLTVERGGGHRVWFRSPDGPSWGVPGGAARQRS